MAFLDDLADFFPDIVTVVHQTHVGLFSVASGTSSVDLNARITNQITKLRSADGKEIISRQFATLRGAPAGLSVKDRFILPARFDPREPEPMSIGYYTDENGPLFTRVFF